LVNVIELTVSIFLLVLGASYSLQAARWMQLLREVTQQPQRLFPTALAMVLAGVFVAVVYHDWSTTWPIFITILGWLVALEGALILIYPGCISWVNKLPDGLLRWYLRLGGALLVILGALLLRHRIGV
jgi:hypothetical protein